MATMDLVNQFNSELSSLYESKPPISKGKMTSVTKAALKAVKLYKHVVQSVEKFIQKCKPEYKVPGLYVIDSIIRQSRHQYGPEKDIFAGRFARNLQSTFAHLYRCPEEDKSKIIRVLNLWQKNKIYTPEIIQPLFDLADPNHPIWETIQKQEAAAAAASIANSSNIGGQAPLPPLDHVQFKKELLDYDYEEDDGDCERNMGQSQHQYHAPPPPLISQSHHQNDFSTNNLTTGLDALGSILTNPEVLRHLQTLQEQIAATAAQQQQQQMSILTPEQERQRRLNELNKQEAAFDQRLAQTVSKLPFAVECGFSEENQQGSPRKDNYLQPLGIDQNSNQLSNHQQQSSSSLLLPPPFFQQLSQEQQRLQSSGGGDPHGSGGLTIPSSQNPFGIPIPISFSGYQHDHSQNMSTYSQQMQDSNNPFGQFQPPQSLYESNFNDERERDRHERRRRRSRSIDRNRPGSRSPTGNKFRRRSRSNSRNRNRKRYSNRSRSRDRKEDRERERERQRKGFPPAKRDHLSVCSTTLWVGHLSRQVAEEEISDTFGPYGDIISIDLILSRGCAFVVMNRRQDACRALDRLKNTKLQSKTITLAWAPGKGVKGRDWKDYWEVEAGVSYIPWHKLNMDTDLEEFEDGGCVDEDTLPAYLKNKPKVPKTEKQKPSTPVKDSEVAPSVATSDASTTSTTTSTAPVPPPDQTIKTGDIDARQELNLNPLPPSVPPPLGPPPMVNSPFGLPPPMGMMPPMGMNVNMMMPPPMLGGPMGVPPQFPGMGFPMMSLMQPTGLNHGLPQPESSPMKPGLLGEMPMQQHLQQMNHSPAIGSASSGIDDETSSLGDENRKRQPDKRENRERKRSRFDEPIDKDSPTREMTDDANSSFGERPLFERLKNLAEGYSFHGSASVESLKNSLLGAPIGPPLRPNMPGPRGFPSPRLPRGAGPFPGPRQPWSDNRDGTRPPWFDNAQSQNPFINPQQNPFAGSPFVQQNSENPFELGNPRPPVPAPGAGPRPETPFFNNRGGWPRDGPWRGDRGGMRRGRGSSRGNWRGRMDEDWDYERDRGFRGGRGGRGMGRERGGGDFDHGRRRDWGDTRDDRDDSREGREHSRGRERRSSIDKNNSQPYGQSSTNISDENWEEECANSTDVNKDPVTGLGNWEVLTPDAKETNNYDRRNRLNNTKQNVDAEPEEVWDEDYAQPELTSANNSSFNEEEENWEERKVERSKEELNHSDPEEQQSNSNSRADEWREREGESNTNPEEEPFDEDRTNWEEQNQKLSNDLVVERPRRSSVETRSESTYNSNQNSNQDSWENREEEEDEEPLQIIEEEKPLSYHENQNWAEHNEHSTHDSPYQQTNNKAMAMSNEDRSNSSPDLNINEDKWDHNESKHNPLPSPPETTTKAWNDNNENYNNDDENDTTTESENITRTEINTNNNNNSSSSPEPITNVVL